MLVQVSSASENYDDVWFTEVNTLEDLLKIMFDAKAPIIISEKAPCDKNEEHSLEVTIYDDWIE